MERKHTFRYDAEQSVQVRLLSPMSGADTEISGNIIQLSDRQLFLRSDRPVRLTTAVRVDLDGGLLLGEVSACTAENGGHRVTVEVDQIIPSLSNLAKLMEAVMHASRGAGSRSLEGRHAR